MEHISFAHRLATDLLRQGSSLGEIGELLGYYSPQTTKVYTKVDLNALRSLAVPWPVTQRDSRLARTRESGNHQSLR
jgi:hypothetical protein